MTGASPVRFLDLSEEESRYEDARVVVLPVPYEGTVSFGAGTSQGPAALLAASREVELWDEELDAEPWREGIHTAPPVPVALDPALMVIRIVEVASELAVDGKLVLAIGGEHSISPPLVETVRVDRDRISVLLIDAHADLRTEWHGTPLSHACTAARLVPSCSVTVVGVRAFCREEAELAAESGVALFRARELAGRPAADWIPEVLATLEPEVYVSFDVDGLDPSVMLATGTPVPGGLSWWDALALLRAVGRERTVIGMDLVELAPLPGLVAPDFLAAQLAYKMIGYAL